MASTIEYFKKALEKDPNYALAYYGLGASYFAMIWFGVKSTKEALPLYEEIYEENS